MTMCALCRRHLLSGESYRQWHARADGAGARTVCGLCEVDALRAGWIRSQPMLREGATGLRWTVRLVA